MGLLDDFDKRNQETLEFHNHIANEQRRGNPKFNKQVSAGAIAAIWVGVAVGRRVLARYIGGWVLVILLIGVVGCFGFVFRESRRLRIEWSASRQKADRRH